MACSSFTRKQYHISNSQSTLPASSGPAEPGADAPWGGPPQNVFGRTAWECLMWVQASGRPGQCPMPPPGQVLLEPDWGVPCQHDAVGRGRPQSSVSFRNDSHCCGPDLKPSLAVTRGSRSWPYSPSWCHQRSGKQQIDEIFKVGCPCL